MSNKDNTVIWYQANRDLFKRLAMKVELILKDILELEGIPYLDVTSRAKDLESYTQKAQKDKYDDPIQQIKDMAGIRIIAYVESDVEKISKKIESEFQIDWGESVNKSTTMEVDRFGYRSNHYIAKLSEIRCELPEFKTYRNLWFEIQVRTILQHAWAEIEHDRNYKMKGTNLPNEKDIKRRFYLLAGILESTDREFNSIVNDINQYAKEVSEDTKEGNIDIQINAVSLEEFLLIKFSEEIEQENLRPDFGKAINIIEEINGYGINTLRELDNLIQSSIQKGIVSKIFEIDNVKNFTSFLRLIMIINDPELYFTKGMKRKWRAKKPFVEILEINGMNIQELVEKYGFKEVEE
ncbi:hypothetical protein M3629_00350 [Paenibacillus polysaccharolyticus]|uniref:GTP pyrophosphokinase n=1 Tax=Paenibacillus polysaccharolyticus TaxID=582692 RepID=UPI002040B5A3|nr:hypothetical protein [Paenibacillus polysaccharolyticus]MCM3131213.1 hypothetical protein [Paenibacillus polysaccharolyticus]